MQNLNPSNDVLLNPYLIDITLQLTDELEQSFDRRGNRLEPLKSALDLHREKFAQRLEKSSADRQKKKEEAWARMDRALTPVPEATSTATTTTRRNRRRIIRRGLLASIHSKLICSTDPVKVMEPKSRSAKPKTPKTT